MGALRRMVGFGEVCWPWKSVGGWSWILIWFSDELVVNNSLSVSERLLASDRLKLAGKDI